MRWWIPVDRFRPSGVDLGSLIGGAICADEWSSDTVDRTDADSVNLPPEKPFPYPALRVGLLATVN